MYPYIHIGPLSLGTFDIFMWLAFLAAYFALATDFSRRHLPADPQIIVGGLAFAGLAGAKLWHLLEEPGEFLAAPASLFFSRTGFAWFGGFIAGILALIYYARRYRIPLLTLMDACAPATALGYAVGRLGCLISGDGDYGKPTTLPWGMAFPNGLVPTSGPNGTCVEWGAPPDCRVHPTPIYEFIVGVIIFYYLWRLGARLLRPSSSDIGLAQKSSADSQAATLRDSRSASAAVVGSPSGETSAAAKPGYI